MTKNRMFSLSMLLVLSSVAISGCSEAKTEPLVNDEKEVIFTIGENDTLDYYYAEDNWNNLQATKIGVQALYDVLLKAVVQTEYPYSESLSGAVDLKVDEWETTIEDQVAQYGGAVSFTELRDLTLEQLGLADMDALRAKFLYDVQLERIQTRFYTEFRDDLAAEYVNGGLPFHIRHILVKLTDNTNLYNGTITEAQANNLAEVCTRLASGKKSLNSFLEVASSSLNEDSSSSKQGDLGIMDTYTSFVNEFKLGLYTFEAYSRTGEDREEVKDAFGIPDTFNSFYGDGINALSVSACQELANVADDDTDLFPEIDRDLNGVLDDDDADYARSILYNNLFNNHGVQLMNFDLEDSTNAFVTSVDYTKGGTKNVLTDSKGNPIIVVRSTYGVHFIVIEKSPFADDAVSYFTSIDDENAANDTYIELNPDTNEAAIDARIKNYINGGYASSGTAAADANLILYRMFNEYRVANNVTIKDASVATAVDAMIENALAYKLGQIKDAQTITWLAYLRLLQRAAEVSDRMIDICTVEGICEG